MKIPRSGSNFHKFAVSLLVFACCSMMEAAPLSVFDGKTFTGWEGNTGEVWRVESGEIAAGKLDAKQGRNEFLCTTREYSNFEMQFEYKRLGNNGGVQFWSQRIPNHHEMIGFQADFAPRIDGNLYDESRRRKNLAQPSPDVVKQIAVNGEAWTKYRIRAEAPRIRLWVNDVLTVDYTENDPNIPLSGLIGLQIHSGATEVRYRNLSIEELPTPKVPAGATGFLKAGDTVALIGGANLERTRFDGFLQTQFFSLNGNAPAHIRNLAWEGDTVFEQWRDVNFPGIQQQLEQNGATLVLAQFGQMEALKGAGKLPEFVAAFEKMLDGITKEGRRLVLLSPIPFEKSKLPQAVDLTPRNVDVRLYVEAVRGIAKRRNLGFVDLFTPLMGGAGREEGASLTIDGLHLSEAGQRIVAEEVVRQLGLEPKVIESQSPVRQAALELERLWFNYWRPMNWAFLEGDRVKVPFSRDWKDGNKRLFPDELKEFTGILAEAESNVQRALAGEPRKPIVARSSIPTEPPSVRPETPEEELATLTVHPDYQVNLFASEADGVGKVVQIRWDERGRLWALCIPDYPQTKPGAAPHGRLVICEDTDHDGRADKFTVFADGLDMPLGFELGDGGVYLAASSEIWFLKDNDGSGKATEKRLVIGGFGTGDTHQTINSLSWGFGGELWFSQGHSIYSRVETPYGIEQHNRAGVWRLRPRTQQLDNFFENSSAGANNWGVLTDDFGQVFHKEGAERGAFYSVPGLIKGDLALPSSALRVFVSEKAKTVGFDLIGTRHFPEELQGSVIIGGEYDNTLQIHKFGYENGKFVSSQSANIIETKNKAFRPVDVRMGPDGGIYFADWYNPIVGHYQASYRHPDRDTTHGRIWRVVRKNRELVKVPALEGMSALDLLGQLSSPERWVRTQAKRLLFAQPTAGVVKVLDEWFKKVDLEKDGALALQGLGVYEAHETVRPELLKVLLRHADYRVRAYATRTLSSWARTGRLPQALEWLALQVADEHPQVRLEAVVAASYVQDAGAAALAARVLDLPMDAYLTYALTKTLYGLKGQWVEPLKQGAFHFEKETHFLFALKNAKLPEATELIRAQLQKLPEGASGRNDWLVALAEVGSGNDLLWALEQELNSPVVLDTLLETVTRRNIAAPADKKVTELVEKMMQQADPAIVERGLRLAGIWKVKEEEEAVRLMALKTALPAGMRKVALMSLAQIQGAKSVPFLKELLSKAGSEAEQKVAFEVLLVASPETAAVEAIAVLNSVNSPAKATPILQLFMARKTGLAAIEKELQKDGALKPEQARHVLNALNQIGGAEKTLLSSLMKLAGFSAALPVYNKETIAEIVQNARQLGNPVEGRKVFEQTGCVACHAANGVGGKIGPDLSALSRGLPPDMIVTEVLWPALNVKEGYEAASVTLKNGKLITGFKQSETADSIGIRDMNTGEIQTVAHADAATIKIGGTVMPDGLTAPLSTEQVAHLMRYLFELGK